MLAETDDPLAQIFYRTLERPFATLANRIEALEAAAARAAGRDVDLQAVDQVRIDLDDELGDAATALAAALAETPGA